jgi:hypothetical protein
VFASWEARFPSPARPDDLRRLAAVQRDMLDAGRDLFTIAATPGPDAFDSRSSGRTFADHAEERPS